jgi:hypothetical protein
MHIDFRLEMGASFTGLNPAKHSTRRGSSLRRRLDRSLLEFIFCFTSFSRKSSCRIFVSQILRLLHFQISFNFHSRGDLIPRISVGLADGFLCPGYTVHMDLVLAVPPPIRRPRFRRASEPPAFRLTDDDVAIVRQLARHRFLRSTHIAALVGRSLDRTNDRLSKLFHAGYIDRPRAQLDRFPTAGLSHFVYALADRGARLLTEHDGLALPNPRMEDFSCACGHDRPSPHAVDDRSAAPAACSGKRWRLPVLLHHPRRAARS